MGNFLTTIKRFLGNKNTVTIIGVILGVIVLYIGYNYRVKQATTPIRVPYAKESLSSRTLITTDMIGYMEISSSVVQNSPNLITDVGKIVNNYVSFGTTIPANSMFYDGMILASDEMPDSAFADIPDGYTVYSLDVNLHTTYGNSMYPGNYIDLYLHGTDDTGKLIYAKFIESIEIAAVKDGQGQHVFETTIETRTPSEMQFAVPTDMYELLMKAEYLGLEIVPVPRNASYSANPGETWITSDTLRDFILSKSATIPQNQINPNANNNNNTNTNTNNATE